MLEEAAEESLSGIGVRMLLAQDVQHLAVLIDGLPKVDVGVVTAPAPPELGEARVGIRGDRQQVRGPLWWLLLLGRILAIWLITGVIALAHLQHSVAGTAEVLAGVLSGGQVT